MSQQPNQHQLDPNGKGDEFDNLYAGTTVPLEIVPGRPPVEFRVFPAGIEHMKRFSKAVQTTLRSVATMDLGFVRGPDGKVTIEPAKLQGLIPMILDVIVSDMLDIFTDCVSPRITARPGQRIQGTYFVPHWHMPALLEAWLIENFGAEDRLRPWVQVIENMVFRTTGERAPIWGTLSKFLSPAAIRAAISSSAGSSAATGSTTPTEGGQSPSSGTESHTPSDS